MRRRAADYCSVKDFDRALADLAAVRRIAPDDADLYLTRANILTQEGDPAGAAAEAARLSNMPSTSYAHVAPANLYSALSNRDAAMREFDFVLGAEPAAYIYVNRAESRPVGDVAARRADFASSIEA